MVCILHVRKQRHREHKQSVCLRVIQLLSGESRTYTEALISSLNMTPMDSDHLHNTLCPEQGQDGGKNDGFYTCGSEDIIKQQKHRLGYGRSQREREGEKETERGREGETECEQTWRLRRERGCRRHSNSPFLKKILQLLSMSPSFLDSFLLLVFEPECECFQAFSQTSSLRIRPVL